MSDLVLSVLFSSLIFVLFKLFPIFKVETLYAIIVNYFTACTVGLFMYPGTIVPMEIVNADWFWGTVAMGILFILTFNLMAATAQKLGVSVASVATKMSLVIPVVLGVIMYNEQLGAVKTIGVLMAVAAVYFASIKERQTSFKLSALLLPVLVFLGSGTIDVCLKYFQEFHVPHDKFSLFSAAIFASAAVSGLIFIAVKGSKKTLHFNGRNIIGGIVLGVPNFFSIFFLLRALENETFNSASVFTINNVAIVMLSTLLAILLFKERLSNKNWGGIALAVISIILVARY